ncbi:MAG: general stress protein [Clostridiales bacterium]|nr:general stress protein [Clostridiales bacterium]
MSKRITAIFNSQRAAHEATERIRKFGIPTESVSIVTKEDTKGEGFRNEHSFGSNQSSGENISDNISDGTRNGALIGAAAGLLAGLGSIAVPGLGVIAAAGPIAGLLGGAVTGGVVGALVDLGIPEEKAREYEGDIKSGKVLWSMDFDDSYDEKVMHCLRESGAEKVY